MTKPELLLNYTVVDEGVPLITDGIVLEINRRKLTQERCFVGLAKNYPISNMEGLGTESGEDNLGALWDTFHEQKGRMQEILVGDAEIGVTYPSAEKGFLEYGNLVEAAYKVIFFENSTLS